VSALLAPFGFRDPIAADVELQRLASDPTLRERLAELLPDLLRCLSESADPDQALGRLERFMRASLGPLQLLADFSQRPHSMELLVRAFGASSFMAEILVRNPPWFHWLADPQVLERSRGRAAIETDLDRFLAPLSSLERRLAALRIVRRREILHIGVRDLLRLATVEETLGALTLLAEVLVQKAYELAEQTLRSERGLPPLSNEALTSGSGFTVLALGKLGAGELNFSSDVDLVYLYSTDRGRMARGAAAPARDDYYTELARRVTAYLAETTGKDPSTVWTCVCGPREPWERWRTRSAPSRSTTAPEAAPGSGWLSCGPVPWPATGPSACAFSVGFDRFSSEDPSTRLRWPR